jgi:hypothetical protein
MRTGSKSVVCNVVKNAWSDEAREASAEARRVGTKANIASSKAGYATVDTDMFSHADAAAYHTKMGRMKTYGSKGEETIASLHKDAAALHQKADSFRSVTEDDIIKPLGPGKVKFSRPIRGAEEIVMGKHLKGIWPRK